jgi:hypothetical protein
MFDDDDMHELLVYSLSRDTREQALPAIRETAKRQAMHPLYNSQSLVVCCYVNIKIYDEAIVRWSRDGLI